MCKETCIDCRSNTVSIETRVGRNVKKTVLTDKTLETKEDDFANCVDPDGAAHDKPP